MNLHEIKKIVPLKFGLQVSHEISILLLEFRLRLLDQLLGLTRGGDRLKVGQIERDTF